MGHLHSVYDSDTHFSIDPITRAIRNESDKNTIQQYDHNSERFTFEIPRHVEGHDMSLCDKIEVHYINISADKKEKSEDVYIANDTQISPDDDNVVIFSWLISGNATKYAGILSFLVCFKCLDGNIPTYAWNTAVNSEITVGESINNGKAVIVKYADVWNGIQGNGNRDVYRGTFMLATDLGKWFYPTHNFVMRESSEMFRGAAANELLDLSQRLRDCGVKLDTSASETMTFMFAHCSAFKIIPPISLKGITSLSNGFGVFTSCRTVETIEGIEPSPTYNFNQTFNSCDGLTNLTIIGEIAVNGLNLQWSPLLTHDSLMSIINSLADKSGDTSTTWLVTIGSTNKDKLTTDELNIAYEKGWVIE